MTTIKRNVSVIPEFPLVVEGDDRMEVVERLEMMIEGGAYLADYLKMGAEKSDVSWIWYQNTVTGNYVICVKTEEDSVLVGLCFN